MLLLLLLQRVIMHMLCAPVTMGKGKEVKLEEVEQKEVKEKKRRVRTDLEETRTEGWVIDGRLQVLVLMARGGNLKAQAPPFTSSPFSLSLSRRLCLSQHITSHDDSRSQVALQNTKQYHQNAVYRKHVKKTTQTKA